MTYQLILCTCPDEKFAEQIAQVLVEQRLAACVNIIPQISSIYRWQDKVETAKEYLLIIKTKSECYAQLEQCIKLQHPYAVPEIIGLDITQGLPDYLKWIDKSLDGLQNI